MDWIIKKLKELTLGDKSNTNSNNNSILSQVHPKRLSFTNVQNNNAQSSKRSTPNTHTYQPESKRQRHQANPTSGGKSKNKNKPKRCSKCKKLRK